MLAAVEAAYSLLRQAVLAVAVVLVVQVLAAQAVLLVEALHPVARPEEQVFTPIQAAVEAAEEV